MPGAVKSFSSDLESRKVIPIMPAKSLILSGLIVAVLAFGGAAAHSAPVAPLFATSTLTVAQIESIESGLKMPFRGRPLSDYERFYTVDDSSGKPVLVGVFVASHDKAGIKIVERNRLPIIADGGCSVVNVRYALDEKRMISIQCNGVA